MIAHSPLLVDAASLFSAETQDVSPFTTPGNTQIRTEEPKPPVSETSSWTISDWCDSSANVADSADDPATFEHAGKQGRVSSPLVRDLGPLQHNYDKNQRNPVIDDTLHVNRTAVPVQGIPRSPSPRPDPSGKKPTLSKILTNTRFESRGSDSAETAFYTPGGNVEVVDRKPFDSAMNIRVVYSGSSSRSQNVIGGPDRGVVEVCQPMDEWRSKYQFPTQALQLLRSDSKIAEDTPRQERRSDSTLGFPPSPSDEFQRDADLSSHISEVNTPTTVGLESRPKSKLPTRDEGNNIQGGKRAVFPKQKERDDHSCASASTEYVSVSKEVEEHSQSQDSTRVSSARPVIRHTT